MKIISIALLCVVAVTAQVTRPGNCPEIGVIDPFNIDSYMGLWYEIESYFQFFSIGATCVRANYTNVGNGTVIVYNSQLNREGEFDDITGDAKLADSNSTEAKLLVSFPSVGAMDSPYWVLDSDYDSYAIVWSCTNSGDNSLQTVWFLSRDSNPSNYTRGYVYGYLNALDLSTELLQVRRQDDCDAMPLP